MTIRLTSVTPAVVTMHRLLIGTAGTGVQGCRYTTVAGLFTHCQHQLVEPLDETGGILKLAALGQQ